MTKLFPRTIPAFYYFYEIMTHMTLGEVYNSLENIIVL